MEIFDVPIAQNRKDSRLHGSYEFPVAAYDVKLENLPQGFINWHWHDELHFYIVKKGRVAFHVHSAVYELGVGEGLFINCGCTHMVKPIGSSENSFATLFVHPKLLSGFQGSVIERKYIQPYINAEKIVNVTLQEKEPWQSSILNRLGRLYELCESQQDGYELEVVLEWIKIWQTLIANMPVDDKTESNAASSSVYRKMKTILSYINENYAEKITLKEIAQTVNLSRNECCRFFKQHANCTVFQYIMDYRINKASELLASKDMEVKEVAYATGFGDAGYFITSFKNKTGRTPKEYRNNILCSE